MTPGELIRAARIAASLTRQEGGIGRKVPHLTQDELAARLGVSQARVSAIERGIALVDLPFVALVLAACKLPEGWTP